MNKFILELDTNQASVLHFAVHEALRKNNICMIGETPYATGSLKEIGKWYAPHSHMDRLVRLYTRLTRILTGHKQYNAEIQFSERKDTP